MAGTTPKTPGVRIKTAQGEVIKQRPPRRKK